ncbi:hypothetical protein N9H93_00640 [Rhizobiaceae bacterium]|nr:hypothetical protein [Rhizobiaceae bacterium]
MALTLGSLGLSATSSATTYGTTIPDGNNSQIPNTFPAVGGTVVVLEGANGNLYYQFVNPSTQFEGFSNSGTPVAFRGNPFQLGPRQTLNCGPTACTDYFGGSIVRLFTRLTVRDADACPGNFDVNDITFRLNGIDVADLSNAQAERTNRTGTTSLGFENCFRNQGTTETSTGWFTSTNPALLSSVLTLGYTEPRIFDRDPGDNAWFFRDGNDATGTPEVAPGITIVKTADRTSYAAVGDIINYSFAVRNVGSVRLTNVTVTDSFITGGISCPTTTLQVQGVGTPSSMTCTGQHIVTQANIDNDRIFTNVARVTATPTEGSLGAVSGTLQIPGPDATATLSIVKTPSSAGPFSLGQQVTYTYDVQNTGNVTIDAVTVVDTHLGAGTLSAVSPASVTLAPTQTQQFQTTYTVTQQDIDNQVAITNDATLAGTPRRGTLSAGSDDASVTVAAPVVAVSLIKATTSGPLTTVGQRVDYTYTVTNNGTVSLTSAAITDDQIATVSCPAPVGGRLAPGASLVCTGFDTVEQQDLDLGFLTNEATATGTFATGATAQSAPSLQTVNADQTTSLTVEKAITSAAQTFSTPGQVLDYSYTVTNTGNVTLTTVDVADDRIDAAGGAVVCPVPSNGIQPSGTVVCTGSYTVTQQDIDANGVTNIATAIGNGVLADDTSSVTVPAAQSPAFTLTKTAQQTDSVDFFPGSVIDYVYVVTNSGNVTLNDPITVSDNLIGSVICDPIPAPGLAPLGTLQCAGQYTITSEDVDFGSVTNLASASDGTTTSPQAEETIPDGGVPGLAITKTSPTATFTTVGETIDYSFLVENTGTTSMVNPIFVNDPLIAEDPLTCFAPTPGDPDLRAGETVTCTGTYLVTQADIDSGSRRNEATASTTQGGVTISSAPSTATVNATQTAAVEITKSAAPDPFGLAGTDVVYTLSVQNVGNVSLRAVTISDPKLPALTCPPVALAPNEINTTCTGTYRVTQADFDAGTISNTASVAARDPGNNPVADSVTLDTAGQPANPTWTLTKDTTSVVSAVGDVASYTFVLANTGDVTISGIAVSDPLCEAAPVLTIGDGVELGIGESWTYACEVIATQAQIDAGSIENVASASGASARGTLADAPATDTLTIAPTPALELDKTLAAPAPAVARAGDVLAYTFTVRNTGNVTLNDVVVTDASATVSGGPISLAPGASDTTSFTASYELTQANIDSGAYQNQAAVSGTTPGNAPVGPVPSDDPTTPAAGDPTVTPFAKVALIELVKGAVPNFGADNNPDAGETISYNFTVRNTGNVTVRDITLNDPAVAVTGAAITLLPGEEDFTTFSAIHTLTQAEIDSGTFDNQATASGLDPDNAAVSDISDSADLVDGPGDDDVTATLLGANPRMSLTKTGTLDDGGDGLQAGDEIIYSFAVTNTGNVTLVDIAVTDPMIGPVAGNIATLAPGVTDSTSIPSVRYSLTQADLDNGLVENSALATGSDPSPNGEPVLATSDDPANPSPLPDDPTVTVLPVTPGIALVKVATPNFGSNGRADVGDLIDYVFTVTNTGNQTISNVTVTDPGADVFGNPITIAAFASETFLGSRVLTQADIDAGTYENQATVTAQTPQGDVLTDASDPADPGADAPTITPLPVVGGIELIKSAQTLPPGPVAVGTLIDYDFVVINNSNVTLRNIVVTDPLATVNGTVAVLAPGALDDVSISGQHALTQAEIDSGSFANQANATADLPAGGTVTDVSDDDGVNATDPTVTIIPQNPSITVDKIAVLVDGGDGVQAGDRIDYTFIVRNTGNVTLSNVTINDPDANVSGTLASLPVGGEDTTTFTASYTLQLADVNAGSFQNQATVNARDPLNGPVSDLSDDPANPANVDSEGDGEADDPTVTALTQAASIAIEKTADISGLSANPAAGETISYTFTIRNTGNVTVDAISVTDPDATTVVGTPVSLDPNLEDTTTWTATRVLTQADIDAGVFANQATASGTAPGGTVPVQALSDDPTTPGVAGDPTNVPLPAAPSIELVKTATLVDGGDGAQVGDTIDYTFTVTNTGTVTLSDITITDTLAPVGGTLASLAPGVSDITTFSGSYALTQADIDAGTVSNSATANATDPAGGAVSDVSDSSDAADGAGDADPTVTPIPAAPSIAIVKSATPEFGADGQADDGDTINYAFTITNTGNVTVSGITVSDASAIVSGGPITLAPDTSDSTTITAVHTITQAEIDAGTFSNSATATGQSPGNVEVSDVSDSDDPTLAGNDDPTVTVFGAQPSIAIEKTADLSALSEPAAVGDVVSYTFTVINTGNVTLTDVTVLDADASVSGGPIALAVNASDAVTFTATRVLTQAEIDAGTLSNQATASGNPPTGPPVSALSDDPTTPTAGDPTISTITRAPSLTLTKSLDANVQQFPYTFEAGYTLTLTNDGNVTATGVTLADDLSAALAPATLLSARVVSAGGFTTGGTASETYDGSSDTATITGETTLAPGATATVVLSARLNTLSGSPARGNVATAGSLELPASVPSNDPTVTPADVDDTNPTPLSIIDSDGDGAVDGSESTTADRDGDGIADANDYDPTGYFYCEENGAILPGGLITVTGPLGSQTGVGSANNITIVRDGAAGSFQFFVSAVGRYTLSYDLPATGVASTDRLPGGPVDLTAFPTDPAVLGSGEFGSTGQLADFTEGANPFSVVFDVEAGDPNLFNVNIPLRFCGAPALTAGKSVQNQRLLASGAALLSYELSIANESTTQVSDVTLADDLDAVFGAGNATVANIAIVNAGGATLALNPGYNGSGDVNVLRAGDILAPGGSAIVRLDVEVSGAPSGDYTNTVAASGTSPLDGSPLDAVTASALVSIVAGSDAGEIVMTKAASQPYVRVGDVVAYTITAQNTGPRDRLDLRIVDRLPVGFVYRPGSAKVDGVSVEPIRDGQRLIFDDIDIAFGATREIRLTLGMGAGATGDEFINRTFAEDPRTGNAVSNIATATVRREIEHVFDCGEIIGKVFDDKNADGYQNEGEPGLPGVRVVTVRGLLVTTDQYGRFSVACADVPNYEIGSNFIMKLDKRTLPTGYVVTTENPRVFRLTRGKITKLNFGAKLDRAVVVDLDARAFVGTTIEPGRALDRGIDQLVVAMKGRRGPAVRVTYRADGRRTLSKARLARINDLLEARWRAVGGTGRLDVETRIGTSIKNEER